MVHIGAPKTGSSAIQAFLRFNAEALATRGIRYARRYPGRGSQLEMAQLAILDLGEPLRRGGAGAKRFHVNDLEKLAQIGPKNRAFLTGFPKRFSEPCAVFSSEHPFPWFRETRQIEAQHRIFADAFEDVRYLLYLREPVSFLKSEYSERVRRGLTHDVDAFVLQRLKGFDFYDRALVWRDALGDRLEIRLVQDDTLVGGDLIVDFCDWMGTQADGLTPPPRANQSLTAVGCAALAALNHVIPEFEPDGRRNPVRLQFERRIERETADAPRVALKRTTYDAILDSQRPAMERLRAAQFPDRDRLFDVPPPDPALDRVQVGQDAARYLAQIVAEACDTQDARDAARTHRGDTAAANPDTPLQDSPHQDAPQTIGKLTSKVRAFANRYGIRKR